MKKLLQFITLLMIPYYMEAQCPTDLLTGQNLVTNGDFSQGYTGWTFTPDTDGNPSPPDGYIIFNPPVTQNYSQPGFIYAGANGNFFNSAFANTSDHTSTADNMMLMVDGVCSNGIKLWSQSGIPVKANTNYYFSVWVRALKDGNTPPGTLQFDINGANLATTITAPTNLAAGWVQYETVWNSGATPPATVTISIENTTTTGCDQYVDFAIDDITFIPGCTYGAVGPQPDLGPDQTLCGRGGSPITLSANVPVNATTTVTWSTGASGTGVGAPYSINVNAPGTYSVCVSDNGSCTKSDVIVITNDYSIELGPNLNLCSPASYILDAGFTGTGVTYTWYRNHPTLAPAPNNTKTYFVNTPGTYRVIVNDPACGARQDEITVTSTAPTPTDAYFCNPGNVTLTVNPVNLGKYKWWNHPTSTALANRLQVGGNTYTFSASGTSDYTFYVEDTTSYAANVGPPETGHGFSSLQGRAVQSETELIFNVTTAFTLDFLTIEAQTWSCPDNRTFQITILNSGGGTVGVANINTTLCGAGGAFVQARVPIGINIPVGTGYKMKLTGGSNFGWYQNGATYPMTYTPMTITGNSTSGWANNAIPSFLKWEITVGTGCTRIPIRAIYNCAMPVEWLSFDATRSGDVVNLNWSTSKEVNNAYYLIERSSDGINFTSIGSVNGSGNSGNQINYFFVDQNPLHGTNYYRLVQFDFDGTSSLSEVRSVNISNTSVTVSPNPANDQVTIGFAKTEGEIVVGLLYNTLGELVMQKYFAADGNYVSENISIAHLASGVYYLHLTGSSERETIKIVKE